MSIDNNDNYTLEDKNFHSKLESAVYRAQCQCTDSTYDGYYGEPYNGNMFIWSIGKHILSNGLYVYTVLCRDWYRKNDNIYHIYAKYRYGYYDYDMGVDIVNPYPYANMDRICPKVITIFSTNPLNKEDIHSAITYKDIDFLIPDNLEKVILIYSKTEISLGKYRRNYRYVFGGKDITEKYVTNKYIDYISDDVMSKGGHYHRNAWPVKEVQLEQYYETHRLRENETVEIFGRILNKNDKYVRPYIGEAKTMIDVIGATLKTAKGFRDFSETNAMNNVRRLNEMLGIQVRYPDEVEEIKRKEEERRARRRIEELNAEMKKKEKKNKEELEKLKREIERQKEIIERQKGINERD